MRRTLETLATLAMDCAPTMGKLAILAALLAIVILPLALLARTMGAL